VNSPQRPHCRTCLVGNFTMGLVAAAIACSPRARSSSFVSGGPRRRGFITEPSSRVCAARLPSYARPALPCPGLPFADPLCLNVTILAVRAALVSIPGHVHYRRTHGCDTRGSRLDDGATIAVVTEKSSTTLGASRRLTRRTNVPIHRRSGG
jgi:hypothetical protein